MSWVNTLIFLGIEILLLPPSVFFLVNFSSAFSETSSTVLTNHPGFHIQAIYISGNFFLISLSLSSFDVQPIELLCVLLNCHPLLSQVLHLPEQVDLIIFGHELSLQLGYHYVPILYLLLSLASPLSV